jgi:hypothetical protein
VLLDDAAKIQRNGIRCFPTSLNSFETAMQSFALLVFLVCSVIGIGIGTISMPATMLVVEYRRLIHTGHIFQNARFEKEESTNTKEEDLLENHLDNAHYE